MPMMFFFFVCSCTGYFFARCARIKGDLPGLAGYLGSVLVLLSSPAATRVDPTKDPVQCTLLARVPMFIIVTVLCFYQLLVEIRTTVCEHTQFVCRSRNNIY